MSKTYRNTSGQKVVIQGQNGHMITILPGDTVDLPYGIARRGMPYLKEVNDTPDTRQVLIEAPHPVEEVAPEPAPEKTETDKKESVSVDVDGDGVADVEVKGEIVEEEKEESSKRSSRKKRKSSDS